MVGKKDISRLIVVAMCCFVAVQCQTLYAQNFNLKPPLTRLVERYVQPTEEGFLATSYHFQSRQSQKEILTFYSRLLGNEGFKQMRPDKGKTKYIYYFAKQKANTIVILSFLPDVRKGDTVYHVVSHEFDPKQLAQWPLEEEE